MSTLTTVGIVLTALMIFLYLLALTTGITGKETRDATRRNALVYVFMIIAELTVLASLIAKG